MSIFIIDDSVGVKKHGPAIVAENLTKVFKCKNLDSKIISTGLGGKRFEQYKILFLALFSRDIIIVYNYFPVNPVKIFLLLLLTVLRRKTNCFIHGDLPWTFPDLCNKKRMVEKFVVSNFSFVFRCLYFPSTSTKENVLKTLKFSKFSSLNVINNTISDSYFIDSNEVTSKEVVTSETNYILVISNNDPIKRVEWFVQVFREVVDRLRLHVPEVKLVVVGSGYDQNLSDDDVLYVGARNEYELIKLYDGCNFFVHPSKHETFGIPLVEALSRGKLVLVESSFGVPEAIGSFGVKLCEGASEVDWKTTLIKIAENIERFYSPVRVLARKEYAKSFSAYNLSVRKSELLDENFGCNN
ncbi:glycosyltransferase [Litoribrevibacter albus]|uniref:Glycosyl transferase family 1 domain-containing protein n=1 Tax=Litoribrevibacter albus TaxID=1473156 RepID=A0AA37SC88_9GAMM|nr:glycosyltransferase [Litoribrevibacter albus]GLQ33210.1 hypothetical protein GCM10007876_36900 [Litoribrevibacter albus]